MKCDVWFGAEDNAQIVHEESNAALSGSGPKESQETPWPVPAVRLNA